MEASRNSFLGGVFILFIGNSIRLEREGEVAISPKKPENHKKKNK